MHIKWHINGVLVIKWHKWCTNGINGINGVLVNLIVLYNYIRITATGLLIDASPVAFITSKKIRQISSLTAASSTVLLPRYCRMWDLSKKFDVTVEQGNDHAIRRISNSPLISLLCTVYQWFIISSWARDIVINCHSKALCCNKYHPKKMVCRYS